MVKHWQVIKHSCNYLFCSDVDTGSGMIPVEGAVNIYQIKDSK